MNGDVKVKGLIGFMVVEPARILSAPPVADWDGEIHPTREQADAEALAANSSGSEPDDTPDDIWRVVAVVEADAIAEAEKRGAVKALRKLDGLERASLWADGTSAFADAIESGAVIL